MMNPSEDTGPEMADDKVNSTPSPVGKQEDDSSDVIAAIVTSTSHSHDNNQRDDYLVVNSVSTHPSITVNKNQTSSEDEHQARVTSFRNLRRRQPIPARQRERRNVSAETRESRTRTHHFSSDETANWRYLSQPRHRRLVSRAGLPSIAFAAPNNAFAAPSNTFSTPSNAFATPSNASDYEPEALYGSELRMRFALFEKSAVEVSIMERIKSVETEVDRLREEREKLLRELEDEMESADVDERWEEGIMAIDEIIDMLG